MLLLYALARPILPNAAPSSAGNSTLFDPVTGECDDINGCRTVPQILWDCLSVTFICTWVAIHPNVPHVKAHRAVVLCCNFLLMTIAMLAPEIIIFWAMKQRYSAKAIGKRFQKYEWGVAHGFLVIMGGFALYDGDNFCGYLCNDNEENVNVEERRSVPLEIRYKIQKHHQLLQSARTELDLEKKESECVEMPPEGYKTSLIAQPESESVFEPEMLSDNSIFLEYLIKNQYIRITEDEIMDNLSHSDTTAKIIAVIQTSWFLLQVGARAIEELAITELEIITVGFAVLSFGTYFLWWNKPLRVRHPVRVYWRQHEIAETGDEVKNGANGWVAEVLEFVVGVWDSVREASVEIGKSMVVLFNFFKMEEAELNNDNLPSMNWVTLLQLVGLPFLVVFRLILASMLLIADDSDYDEYMALVVNSSRLRRESSTPYILIYGLAALLGAIHCIPWNFQFPTPTAQSLWRFCAGGLVALPLAFLIYMAILGVIMHFIDNIIDRYLDEDSQFYQTIRVIQAICILSLGFVFFSIIVTLPIVYIFARVILMVLALMELQNLPLSAYQTVQWTVTTFIPHIG